MWMAVDYGQSRIGLALYDETSPLAVPRALGTLQGKRGPQAVQDIADMAERNRVSRLIVGIPLAPDGGLGQRARQVRNFARMLEEASNLPVVLQDERDSSREALDRLIAAGVSMKRRAQRIDEMAAVVILERYVQGGEEPRRIDEENR